MNADKQRQVIAISCGWTVAPDTNGCWISPEGRSHGWFRDRELPDFLNDLNAMHDAECAVMDKDETIAAAYAQMLYEAVHENLFHLATLGPAKKAECFLKTLGLWTDEA